jgi:transcriptional regulator with XRE-family HTH domain
MIGSRIKFYRNLKSMTQTQLAEKIFKSQTVICRIESGDEQPNKEELKLIAQALQVNINDLQNDDPIIIHNESSNYGTQGIRHIENHITMDKKEIEKMLEEKTVEILWLRNEVNRLLTLVENSFKK